MSHTVVIAGAGVMGASLAQVYALAGYQTIVYDVVEAGLSKGRHMVDLNQETMIREGLVTPEDSAAMLERIRYTMDKECFRSCDLVVECIVERMDVKHAFWREVSAMVPPTALLATNTSGLRISQIAEAVERPERFMGQHWLNPPHLIPMCEIIAGEKTDPACVEQMRQLVLELGKSPVVVKDIPGFVSNRLQFALLREALYIVESGAATLEDVDTVLKAGLGLRYAALGPFGVADFGGWTPLTTSTATSTPICATPRRDIPSCVKKWSVASWASRADRAFMTTPAKRQMPSSGSGTSCISILQRFSTSISNKKELRQCRSSFLIVYPKQSSSITLATPS